MDIFINPLLGGAIIGLSASILWLGSGKTAGISGIVGGMLQIQRTQVLHRTLFLFGLIMGGVTLLFLQPKWVNVAVERSIPTLIIAGLLVGVGTRVGSGCTSGHGVCGISKWSMRSIVATVSFMFTGFLIATIFAGSSI